MNDSSGTNSFNNALPAISIALAGLWNRSNAPFTDARSSFGWISSIGYRAVQLDGAQTGLRPRDLDRSARRDLAATLRRTGLMASGVDLWIPPAHFLDGARADRAVAAVGEACGFVSELSRLDAASTTVVSLELPRGDDQGVESILRALSSHAQESGAIIADFTWPPRETSDTTLAGNRLGLGVDPSAIGSEFATEVSRSRGTIVAARWSGTTSAGRVGPLDPRGRLSAREYFSALAAADYQGPVVLDLRGVPDAFHEAAGVASWLATRVTP